MCGNDPRRSILRECRGTRQTRLLKRLRGQAKLRNGLFLNGVVLYEDRIVFEVFASHALHTQGDLSDLRFTDDLGTKYEMVPPESGAIEGKACIEFRPAVPAGWSHLQLSQPGWGHHVVRRPE